MVVKRSLILYLLLLGLIYLSGCAITDYTITRAYDPQVNKLENTQNYSICTKVNYTAEFTSDVRAVGVKKNGYNQETARVYLNDSVENWILNAFQQELKMAGYLINDKNAKNQINVTMNVEQFFVEPWVGFWSANLWSILKIETKVEIANKNEFYIRKFVSYNSKRTPVWPDNMFSDRIIAVAQKTIPDVVRQINILLKEKTGGNEL